MRLYSNYADDPEGWNSSPGVSGVTYVKCNACFGTGEDRNGRGDCIECEGFGDVEVRY